MIPAPACIQQRWLSEIRNAELAPHQSAYRPAAGFAGIKLSRRLLNLHNRVQSSILGIPEAVIDGNSTVNASQAPCFPQADRSRQTPDAERCRAANRH